MEKPQVSGYSDGRGWVHCKPSAKPTLVRTQHLPLPAETARELGIPVSRAVAFAAERSRCVHESRAVHRHIADSVRDHEAVAGRRAWLDGARSAFEAAWRTRPGSSAAWRLFAALPSRPTSARPVPSDRAVGQQDGAPPWLTVGRLPHRPAHDVSQPDGSADSSHVSRHPHNPDQPHRTRTRSGRAGTRAGAYARAGIAWRLIRYRGIM